MGLEGERLGERTEAVARAICVADGGQPDDTLKSDDPRLDGQPMWKAYETEAKRWLAAHEVYSAWNREAAFK